MRHSLRPLVSMLAALASAATLALVTACGDGAAGLEVTYYYLPG